jgi:baseplate J-like protein|nr:MAG TPA: Baseplate J like protein [Caudoviricetes sp.]
MRVYEDKTYKSILADAKNDIGDEVIKVEGSLVHNALSALAYEMEKLYIQIDYIIEQSHAGTADIEHLETIALDRAIIRKAATNAYVKAEFNVAVPIGSRYNLKGYNYRAVEVINDSLHQYKMMVEETGAGPNSLRGDLIPIDYVEGLESAKVTELLVAGDDEESKESLYKRYLESFTSQSFAGNIAAYKEKFATIQGIGGAKIYPTWKGAGTVKAVLISSDYTAVSDYLIGQIRSEAVPAKGSGYGWAPIGHDLTIESVKEVVINVNTQITYAAGYSSSNLSEKIKEKIKEYLKDIAKTWKDGDEHTEVIIYISRLEAVILDVQGVLDVNNTALNKSSGNLTLHSDEIPKLGEVGLK